MQNRNNMSLKFIWTVAIVVMTIAVSGQNKNPFHSIGKDAKIMTLSNGAYDELFDEQDVQQVGTALVNIRTMKVVRLLSSEKSAQRLLDNSTSGRFLSVDPKINSFPWWTPYQFAGNTPVQAMDLDGREIYFYTWDQSKQDKTALQKVGEIDVIKQQNDIAFLTDWFGWRTTQKANLKDLGLEQTWILYDNNWRLVPNNRLKQSLDKISKQDWNSFLTPEKAQQTLDNIKGLGDKASFAVNLLLLADGLKDLYRSVKTVKKVLSKGERLGIFQEQLANAKPASNQEEAIQLINKTLDNVEDQYSGIPKQQGIPSGEDGRMYGILDEKYVETLENGTKVARTKGQRIVLKQDGGFEIQTKDGSKTIFSKPGAQKPGQ